MRHNIDPIPCVNLKDLKETGAFYDDSDPNVIYIVCQPKNPYSGPCPKCACVDPNYISNGFAVERRIHDISIGAKSVDLLFTGRRYKCKDCGDTFTEPINFAKPGYWMTNRLIDQITQRALKEPFINVAEEYGITIPTVAKLFQSKIDDLEQDRVLVAPKVLGIDEVHIQHKMRLVCVNGETGDLIEIASSNDKATTQKVIESMKDYEKIEVVTMDMSGGYKNVIRLCCPDAKIIVDKFHVVRYIYDATKTAKKSIVSKIRQDVYNMPYTPDKQRKLKLLFELGKDSYLFKFNNANVLKDKRRLNLLTKLCAEFPELNDLRICKTNAERIYNDSTTVEEAKANIDYFIDHIPTDSAFADFRKFAKTLRHWETEVLNYFVYYDEGYNNAVTEGVNSKIKRINNAGSGYSFETLRAKCLYYPSARKKAKLKSRKKISSNISVGFMTFVNPEYISGDTTDLDIIVKNLHEIF